MPQKRNSKRKMNRKEVRDLDIKIRFLEGLVQRDPGYVEALQLLGDHYTRRGRFENGLHVDEQLSRLTPDNPIVFYNLACSYSLTGQIEEAAGSLERALDLGYRDFKWLAKDPDLATLREHARFQTIEDKIRRMVVQVS